MQVLHCSEWGAAEVGAAIAQILSGRVIDGPQIELLETELAELSGSGRVHAVSSGRTALCLALGAFMQRAPGRRRVVMPAYVCPSVVECVLRSGLEPVAVDVGRDLNIDANELPNAIDDRTLAVIAPHMYGCPADIGRIEAICKNAGVFLVDDAAQIVGVRHQGRVLGSFGDIGVHSFAQSKSVVTGRSGSGGALLINNADLIEPLAESLQKLVSPHRAVGAFVRFLLGQWASLGGPSCSYYMARLMGYVCGVPEDVWTRQRVSNLASAIARAQLRRQEALNSGKRRVLDKYRLNLASDSRIEFPQYAPGRLLCRTMLLMPDGCDVQAIRADLLGAGIQTRAPYPLIPEWEALCRVATRLRNRLVEAPSWSTMQDWRIARVCDALRTTIARAGNVRYRREKLAIERTVEISTE